MKSFPHDEVELCQTGVARCAIAQAATQFGTVSTVYTKLKRLSGTATCGFYVDPRPTFRRVDLQALQSTK